MEARTSLRHVISENASPSTACPASWTAVIRRACALIDGFTFSAPSWARSVAKVTSARPAASAPRRPALKAASFKRPLSSAPLSPEVRRASSTKFTSSSNCLPFACDSSKASRPAASGRSNDTRRSKRPGLSRAGSSTSARFVAATTKTSLRFCPKPSSSTRSCISEFSRSCSAPRAEDSRLRARASTSSRNTMHGCKRWASAKSRFTSCVPCPAYFEAWKSLPEAARKGKPTSPANARAQCVFPTPGGPSSKTPLGAVAPIFLYFSRLTRASTRSLSSDTASSWPWTSCNVVSTRSTTWKLPSGRDLALRCSVSRKPVSQSSASTDSRPARAAQIADKSTRPLRSAGENAAVLLANPAKSGPSPSNWTVSQQLRRIASRPSASGSRNSSRRSKRPGRNKASSRTSGRLVAASTSTPEVGSNPSICASKAFSVASWSTFAEPEGSTPSRMPPEDPDRRASPTVSTSSIKTTQGASFLACLKSLSTMEVPTPDQGDWRKSLPERTRKGT
mmetsp:Transcript_90898/g.164147  ORF Transcript_90898/g.164147 Transcript_90898/m.164147 type:complete len:508 (-) Transcript_90898:115-1638(-)